jgi:hypothetical protein
MPSPEARVAGPLAPVKPEFRIAGEVIEAAGRWQLAADVGHIRCFGCGQSVLRFVPGTVVTQSEIGAATMAHLMQRHGWTRETHG